MELSDDSFPPEDFGIVSGMLNVKWDRIAPYPLGSVLTRTGEEEGTLPAKQEGDIRQAERAWLFCHSSI